jgi:Uma2 family endonuclease
MLTDSEPEPDFSFVRGDERTYLTRFPGPGEIGLVGEVSDSSLQFDRTEKGRIYARAGIPVYWIINVADRQIEVYTNPDTTANPPAYTTRTDYKPGDTVPITLDGNAAGTILTAELLP